MLYFICARTRYVIWERFPWVISDAKLDHSEDPFWQLCFCVGLESDMSRRSGTQSYIIRWMAGAGTSPGQGRYRDRRLMRGRLGDWALTAVV